MATGQTGPVVNASRLAVKVRQSSRLILQRFEDHHRQFLILSTKAKDRFEQRDWQLARHEAIRRIQLYEKSLTALGQELSDYLGADSRNQEVWTKIKASYGRLIRRRQDIDIAETFFNSATRKILRTPGINRDVEFFHLEDRECALDGTSPVYRRYEVDGGMTKVIGRILTSYSFGVPFENMDRDSRRVADEIDLYVWPYIGEKSLDCIEMIRSPFYRNRVAYLVGRLITGDTTIPFVMPLYHDRKGIYVDAALFRERQVSIIFGFAHTSFCIDIEQHCQLIEFLRSILPNKAIAELYLSIGYAKHAKTVFYRHLHHFIHESHRRFWIAPGQEGSVMIGFTLRDFRFVFKVIKDRPCFLRSDQKPKKLISRSEVMDRYRNVCYQDHVGRLVDTQEFENLRFKRKRFAPGLLREFRIAAKEAVTIERDYVTIHHCYLQRRVIPLPMYLASESDPELVRAVILDFGYFLKDLVSVGIFPTDLFNIWNCGVTSRRRVVLFDYDDVTALRQITFRAKPRTHGDWEEMLSEEDRITAGPNDFFIDEMERYLGVPPPLMGVFRRVHSDLFTLRFWHQMQGRVRRGEVVNIIPYDRSRRFGHEKTPGSG